MPDFFRHTRSSEKTAFVRNNTTTQLLFMMRQVNTHLHAVSLMGVSRVPLVQQQHCCLLTAAPPCRGSSLPQPAPVPQSRALTASKVLAQNHSERSLNCLQVLQIAAVTRWLKARGWRCSAAAAEHATQGEQLHSTACHDMPWALHHSTSPHHTAAAAATQFVHQLCLLFTHARRRCAPAAPCRGSSLPQPAPVPQARALTASTCLPTLTHSALPDLPAALQGCLGPGAGGGGGAEHATLRGEHQHSTAMPWHV